MMGTYVIILKKKIVNFFLISILFMSFTGNSIASENSDPSNNTLKSELYYKQVLTIIKFYDVIINKESPTVRDFFDFFSEHNEGELEIGLLQEYPLFAEELKNFPPKRNDYANEVYKKWQSNPEAKSYADKIYLHPDLYMSKFLKCIKSVEPLFFSKKTTRAIEFPPKHIGDPLELNDFYRYTVLVSDKKIIFEFSPDEITLETIYLPNNENIFDLIPRCVNK